MTDKVGLTSFIRRQDVQSTLALELDVENDEINGRTLDPLQSLLACACENDFVPSSSSSSSLHLRTFSSSSTRQDSWHITAPCTFSVELGAAWKPCQRRRIHITSQYADDDYDRVGALANVAGAVQERNLTKGKEAERRPSKSGLDAQIEDDA